MSEVLPTPPAETSTQALPASLDKSLFLVSVLGLFLELLLIRWIGSELRIFTYLQNAVLLVCFLGMGMGCWTCRQPFRARDILWPLLILVLLMAIPIARLGPGRGDGLLSFFVFRTPEQRAQELANPSVYETAGLLIETVRTVVIILLLWDIFVPLGRLLGRLLDAHPRTIRAYSINVAGSLAGIWLFVLLSAVYMPPTVWFLTAAGLLFWIMRESGPVRRLDVALLGCIIGLSWLASWDLDAQEISWSPYQKLALYRPVEDAGIVVIGEYVVRANNGPYQAMLNLNPEHVRANPQRFPPELAGLSQYDIPPQLHPHPRKMLVVGAGTGNDVAGGLRQGITDITAVDIDPGIVSLGQRFHPEQPYSSPGVRRVIDDARSFFATCTERYDLIVFGLLDSPNSSGPANARLDHYVYTRESLERARALLADGGVLVLTFEVLRPFMPERMFETVRDVFDQDPLYFRIPATSYGWGGVMFVESQDLGTVQKQLTAHPRLARQIEQWRQDYTIVRSGTIPVASDDWPYIYLERPHIPALYFGYTGLLLLLFVRGLWRLQVPGLLRGWQQIHWHFFFLGAAFMLLEVQNISKAAVVLGNTWEVNAVIISSILGLILGANLIASRWPDLPLTPVYGLVGGTCLVLYFVDLSTLAFLPYATKALFVGLLTSLPMLFSGIVFIRSFAAVNGKDMALGANLLGALVGGLLQSVTFLTGIKALLLLVIVLYTAAWLTRPRLVLEPGR